MSAGLVCRAGRRIFVGTVVVSLRGENLWLCRQQSEPRDDGGYEPAGRTRRVHVFLVYGYARLVSALDGKGAVYFETQQSDAGRALLKRCGMPTDLSSIVVVEVSPKGKAVGYVRSTAVLRTFLALGAPWSALYLTVAIPEFIRDGVYGLVAKHRYSVFGTNGGRCALPDAVTRRRIGRELPAGLLD